MARNVVPKKSNRKASLFSRVAALIEGARQRVAQVANIAQVYTNYEIGRQIVEEEQGGKRRAEYGKQILIDLSQKLTARFGRGWSVDNLQRMRGIYLLYSSEEKYATVLRKSNCEEIHNSVVEIQDAVNFANTVYGIGKSDSFNAVERISQTPSGDSVNSVYQINDCKDLANRVCQIPECMARLLSLLGVSEVRRESHEWPSQLQDSKTPNGESNKIEDESIACGSAALLSLPGVLEYGRFAA